MFRSRSGNKEKSDIIYSDLPNNINKVLTGENLKSILGSSKDILFRDIVLDCITGISITLIYIDGMVDTKIISDFVIKPIMQTDKFKNCNSDAEAIKLIDEGNLIYYTSQKKRTEIDDTVMDILSGCTAIIFNKEQIAFTFSALGFEKRSIDEPTGENVIKGAKDSFVETLRTNTATCRRRIRSQNLTIEETIIGKQSKTTIAFIYMKNIVNNNLVEEVKKRIDKIQIDRDITTGYVEEFITDNNITPFPQVLNTERPDKFCSNIVDGRVGLIIDGLPISYIIPATLIQFLQAPEDYSQQFIVSSVIRVIRFASMLVTLLLPAFFVAISTFHQEMIPTELAISIASSKEGVPFPMFVEVLTMLIAFEVLIEAGLRLPRTIGQAVSIVGALVVGQSAVEAKLISPATIVIIAITAIASFTMPNQDFSNALRLWRFILVVLSSLIGIFGLACGFIFLIFHLCTLESFGVPYLDPFVGSEGKQLQDSLFRLPLSTMKNRPISLKTKNKRRMS